MKEYNESSNDLFEIGLYKCTDYNDCKSGYFKKKCEELKAENENLKQKLSTCMVQKEFYFRQLNYVQKDAAKIKKGVRMKEPRYYLQKHYLRNDEIHDLHCHRFLNSKETVELLNSLEEDRRFLKELKIEYKRVNNILNDFMDITNRLQADSKDDAAQMIARDMLIMMGVDLG